MAIPPINLSNIEYEDIYNSLKEYISSKEYFTDFDYEGSAISTIIDLLTYNTYYQLVFQNILVNEMFLDSAQKLESLRSHAKLHGFSIQNRYSSTTNITITNDTTFTIPQYSKFEGRTSTGLVRIFYNIEEITASSDGTNFYATFDLYEAQTSVLNQLFTPNVEKQSCFIPNQNFDFRSLKVTVDGIEYRRGNEVEPNVYTDNKIYYLESNGSGYDVIFASGMVDPNTGESIGDPLTSDSSIRISYLIPSGTSGNGINQISFPNIPLGATLIVNATSSGGKDTLSSDNLKFFIPRSFAAQNRIVTESDIKSALLMKGYATTEADIILVNGYDLSTPEPGTVYVNILNSSISGETIEEFLNSYGISGIQYIWGSPS